MSESVLEKAMFIKVKPSRESPGFFEATATFGYETFPPVYARDKNLAVAFAAQALSDALLKKYRTYQYLKKD